LAKKWRSPHLVAVRDVVGACACVRRSSNGDAIHDNPRLRDTPPSFLLSFPGVCFVSRACLGKIVGFLYMKIEKGMAFCYLGHAVRDVKTKLGRRIAHAF